MAVIKLSHPLCLCELDVQRESEKVKRLNTWHQNGPDQMVCPISFFEYRVSVYRQSHKYDPVYDYTFKGTDKIL